MHVWLKRNSFLKRVCECSSHYTKTLAAEFISCSSRFLSRRRACSKLCSSTPSLTSIPVISLLICDIAFFILTSGAAINTKKYNVQTCNKNKLQHKYFHILQMFFAILKISLDLLFTNCYKKHLFSCTNDTSSPHTDEMQVKLVLILWFLLQSFSNKKAGYERGWNSSFKSSYEKINL